ncbi:unnamed protein product [Prorocentrum cordatum]|uniref:Uncharacterized protein n=1 Tax=Prorocentrum cordatum TaxID=2364126 RepID=A0ABN9UQ65_9DINO|nr:unnamed protein product [Polarella glacialis]
MFCMSGSPKYPEYPSHASDADHNVDQRRGSAQPYAKMSSISAPNELVPNVVLAVTTEATTTSRGPQATLGRQRRRSQAFISAGLVQGTGQFGAEERVSICQPGCFA